MTLRRSVRVAVASATLAVGALPATGWTQDVPVVENRLGSPRWGAGERWTVSPQPVTTIGTVEGAEEYSLFRVIWAGRFQDGRIVLLNMGTMEFRVFDEAGTFLFAFAGQGEEPGELMRPTHAAFLPGDSIVVQDAARMSVFAPDGTFARSFQLKGSRALAPQFMGVLGDLLLLRDGDLAGRTFTTDAQGRPRTASLQAGLDLGRYAFVRYRTDGAFVDTVGTFRGAESWISIEGTRRTFSSIPFARSQQLATGQGLLVTGWNETFELDFFDAAGRPLRRVTLDAPRTKVTEGDFWAFFSRSYRDLPLQQQRATRARYEVMPRHPTTPAFGRIKVDPLGYVWVESEVRRGPGAVPWRVFDSAGRFLGSVDMPDVSVLEIGSDYILGRAVDEYDVESVVMYRLQRGG